MSHMETKTYTTLNRSNWARDPQWDNEPDKVQWADEATGLPCIAVRHFLFGHWCGYVGVDGSHALHDKHHDVPEVSVHGGLTYSGACDPCADEAEGICYVPSEGEPDHVWWFGFDCAHYCDFSPLHKRYKNVSYYFRSGDPSYRTLEYVQAECRSLAA